MKSFAEVVKASQSDLLYLVMAKDKPTGQDAWWYVLVKNKQSVPVFIKKVETTGLTLTDYGEILRCGWGKEPPENTAKEVKEEIKKRVAVSAGGSGE